METLSYKELENMFVDSIGPEHKWVKEKESLRLDDNQLPFQTQWANKKRLLHEKIEDKAID
jgi:hypothetical protein